METNNEKSKSPVTYELFSCVKILLASGSSQAEICRHLNLADTTVRRIKNAESWQDYQNVLAAIRLKYKDKYAKKRKQRYEAEKAKEKAEKLSQEKPAEVPAAGEPLPLKKPEPEPQVIEHRQNITVQTTHFTMQKLDKMIELLTGISAKMACIVEDLYGTKKETN